MEKVKLTEDQILMLAKAYSPSKKYYKEWIFAGAFHTGIYEGIHVNINTAIEDLKHFYKGLRSGFKPPNNWLKGVNAIYNFLFEKTGLIILNEYWIFDGMMNPRKEILTEFLTEKTVMFSTLARKSISVYSTKEEALKEFRY